MKNLLLTVATILSTISVFAQAPQAINYQAVVRNTTGDVIKNQNVRFKLSITEGVAGTTTYAETQQATTSNLGLVNLTIGSGTVATGTFSAVNWATGNKFLKIEIDATGGTTYALMGTQQLVSVPYALHAATSGAVANQWQFNSSGINYNTGNVGIGTVNPNFAVHIERDGDGFGSSAYDQRTMLFLQNTSTNTAANSNLKIGSAGTIGTTNLTNFTQNYNILPGYANCGMLSNNGGGLILQTVQPLRLKVGANAPDRMIISSDGNIGMGTTTPNFALHLERDGDAFGNSAFDQRTMLFLQNTATSAAANTNLKIGSAGTTGTTNLTNFTPNYNIVPGYANCGMLSNNGGGLILQTVQPLRLKVGANTPDRMTINGDGNIGMGTTTPNYALHIERNADAFNNPAFDSRALLYLLNTSTSNEANTYIKVGSSGTTASTNLINYPNSYSVYPGYANYGMLSNNGAGLILQSAQTIRFITGVPTNPDRLIVTSAGNIGIGTSTPVAKLQVTSGDVYIDDSTKGIIMKSPNGNCWRVTIDNTGNMVRTAITCPQ